MIITIIISIWKIKYKQENMEHGGWVCKWKHTLNNNHQQILQLI